MKYVLGGAIFILVLYFIIKRIRHGHFQLTTDEPVDWTKYPRPQMIRNSFFSLNGTWHLDGDEIQVPFPPQGHLSGYKKPVKTSLTYVKKFILPKNFKDHRVILHFGAVDQIAEIWVNSTKVMVHKGGYLPFYVDVTKVIYEGAENELVVKVKDNLSKKYPYGKQCKNPGGMWYTPVSGIWQSVWMESVPKVFIEKIKITPDLTGIDLYLYTNGLTCKIEINLGGYTHICYRNLQDQDDQVDEQSENLKDQEDEQSGNFNDHENDQSGNPKNQEKPKDHNGWCKKIRIDLNEIILEDGKTYEPILWTTENPHLYNIKIKVCEDEVESYFALRTVSIEKVGEVQRICLNGKSVFLHGILDQGYFCDGIFLGSSDKEFERDILKIKDLGFNMLRKHIKVEPELFYFYCDLHGMLVIQDMVNNGHYSFIRDTALPTLGILKVSDTRRGSKSQREIFINHTKDTINHLYNHPCIIGYTIFNEGWGQFQSDNLYEMVKKQDNTRFIDATSGWFTQKNSDVDSYHVYFKTINLPKTNRPLIVSEFGGYTYSVPGHIYSKHNHYGYGTYDDMEKLTDSIVKLYEKMIIPAIHQGLCGCVYTQLSDVEEEINGLYTYDRKICKVNKEKIKAVSFKIKDTMDEL